MVLLMPILRLLWWLFYALSHGLLNGSRSKVEILHCNLHRLARKPWDSIHKTERIRHWLGKKRWCIDPNLVIITSGTKLKATLTPLVGARIAGFRG